MEMVCQAPRCGCTFEAKRKTAKYCSRKCSMRANRARARGDVPAAEPGRPQAQSRLEEVTRSELAAVRRVETSAGQAALVLAARIDAGGAETGSALASMVREHAAAMDRALAGVAPRDPVGARQDEVARRREQHAGAG